MTEAALPARAAWQAFLERYPATATVDLILPDLVGIARGKRLTAAGFASGLERGPELSGLALRHGFDRRQCRRVGPDLGAGRPRPAVPGRSVRPSRRCPGGRAARRCWQGWAMPDGRPSFADPRALLLPGRGAGSPTSACSRSARSSSSSTWSSSSRAAMAGRARCATRTRPRRPMPASSTAWMRSTSRTAFFACLAALLRGPGAAGQECCLGVRDRPVRGQSRPYGRPALRRRSRLPPETRHQGRGQRGRARSRPSWRSPSRTAPATGCTSMSAWSIATGGTSSRPTRQRSAMRSAGLQATMAESMLLCAPNANSYRRLRPLSYAPLAATWGHDNRTVALRVPSGPEAARRIEHRLAGADASPYLVLAAVLAGIHHGLRKRLEPGPPTRGNAYAGAEPDLPAELGAGAGGAGVRNGPARLSRRGVLPALRGVPRRRAGALRGRGDAARAQLVPAGGVSDQQAAGGVMTSIRLRPALVLAMLLLGAVPALSQARRLRPRLPRCRRTLPPRRWRGI